MLFRRIRREELPELASQWHFTLDENELDEYHNLTEYIGDAMDALDSLPSEPAPRVAAAIRDAGRRPWAEEDPYNAIVRWCSVKVDGAEGLLSGVRVGVKDSVAVADVPLTCGCTVLEGFVPNRDATITQRMLNAGAEIVAVLNMDSLAFSAGAESSSYGPTRNPHDPTRSASGSSGGSGAALFYDDIDVTIGCDQGGSIRLPASWCGVIGLKPTHGLVPYVGIAGIDMPIDHAGPMARTADEAARLLQVIAGKDPTDPRQPGEVPVEDYVKAVNEVDDLRGLRVGILAEGFGEAAGVEEETESATREAIDRLAELGADVREVSVPEHLEVGGIAFAGFVEGMTALLTGGGNGYGWKGDYWPELSRAFADGLRTHGHELSGQIKLIVLAGTYLRRQYGGQRYGKAHNLHKRIRAGYDRALAEVDVLAMPTTPFRAHKLDPNASISDHVKRGWSMLSNTPAMNFTGHPAISLPVGEADGLPVALMLVGRHFEDARQLAIAKAFEQRYGWAPTHPGDPRKAPVLAGSA